MDPIEIYEFGSGAPRFRAMLLDQPDRDGWRALDTAEPLAASWTPPKLRFYLPGETGVPGDRKGKNALPTDTDMPIVFGALMTIVSERLINIAGDAIARYGEFLPCTSDDGTFFVY